MAMVLHGCRDNAPSAVLNDGYEQKKLSGNKVASPDQRLSVAQRAELAERNDAIEQTAISLAQSLADKDVRVAIKSEIEKRFDGDCDVLFKDVVEKRLSDNKTFIEKIANGRVVSQRRLGKNISALDATKEVREKIGKVPKFQIGMPYYVIDKWNPDTQIPLVACLPNGVDNADARRIKVFDSEGMLHWINTSEYRRNPFPMLVLGINERVDENGRLRRGIMVQKANSGSQNEMNLQLIAEEGPSGGGGGSTHRVTVKQIVIKPFAITPDAGDFDFDPFSYLGDFLSAAEFYFAVNVFTGSPTERWTSFVNEGQAAARSFYFSPYLSEAAFSPNRDIYYLNPSNLSQSQDVDFVDYDDWGSFPSPFWYLTSTDFVETEWRVGSPSGPVVNRIVFSNQETWYFGTQGRIQFSARVESLFP
jgi:hypothetical protein